MFNSDHVEASLGKIREIFEKASERVESLQPGEKIPATALASQLAAEYGMTGPQLYPVLRFLFDGYPGVLVRRGAHGGILKPGPEASKKKATSVTTEAASQKSELDDSSDLTSD
jgi:hypothetical protein